MIIENKANYEVYRRSWDNHKICPECGGGIITIENSGDMVCSQCGLVIAEKGISFSSLGIRTYNKQDREKKSHRGDPISKLLPYFELTTYIDNLAIQNPDLRRAIKYDRHVSWKKKNIIIAITELRRIGNNLNLPKYVQEATVQLYKQVLKKNIIKGRSIKNMITACAYYVCKEMGIPITFQDILSESSMNNKQFMHIFSVLAKELSLKPRSTDLISLIPKYCQRLGLDHKIEKLTTKLLRSYLEKHTASGKNPKGICAGAIYYASKLKNRNIRQKEIALVTGITEVTLRARYKDISEIKIPQIIGKN